MIWLESCFWTGITTVYGEDVIVIKVNGMSIDFSNLIKTSRQYINWKQSIGTSILFDYDGKYGKADGELQILNVENGMIYVFYEKEKLTTPLTTGDITQGHILKAIGLARLKDDYKLGDVVNKSLKLIEKVKIVVDSEGDIRDGYKYECINDGHVGELRVDTIRRGIGCPVCIGRITMAGVNDVATTHPHIAKYFANVEDTYTHTYASGKKVLMLCPNCGYTKPIVVSHISSYGFGCNKCGDGISYPNKFILNVLQQLPFIFEPEKKFIWSDNKIYDEYIESESIIIENNGMGHYDGGFGRYKGKVNHKKEQLNDTYKEKLAKDNGIKHYIILDCRKSELEWIKNSVMNSELPSLLNFKEEDIDWLKCHDFACSSRVKEACGLWNLGKNMKEIAKIMNVYQTTVSNYLKSGNSSGMCAFNPTTKKGVLVENTGDIFTSQTELSVKSLEMYGVYFDESSISKVCSGKQMSLKGYKFKNIKKGEL